MSETIEWNQERARLLGEIQELRDAAARAKVGGQGSPYAVVHEAKDSAATFGLTAGSEGVRTP